MKPVGDDAGGLEFPHIRKSCHKLHVMESVGLVCSLCKMEGFGGMCTELSRRGSSLAISSMRLCVLRVNMLGSVCLL
ncbi:hypothetical protein MARPO_3570s0001 [Marchantia polymorpha]|uniref:Uncharacterized protein n=1 Tax=Marchantia polymorpha TaxID=3197 RepID=A0A2R6VXE4_MARPO|nr:hypothetical protein MARPO_3570s0001 [Marchantia polymorpha]|eukprot:PTQ26277.1 hypothetical protein MARPO_3570s0001 [Marchantia polymorpha]